MDRVFRSIGYALLCVACAAGLRADAQPPQGALPAFAPATAPPPAPPQWSRFAQPAFEPPAGAPGDGALAVRGLHPNPMPFEAAETVARVGDQYIFRGELLGDANLALAPALAAMPPEAIAANRDRLIAEREQLMDQLLQTAIDRKVMYIQFLRSIPPDKLDEAQQNIRSRIAEAFEENVYKMLEAVERADREEMQQLARSDNRLFRLALLMKQQGITSQGQLDRVLRQYGSSLDAQQQAYAERILGQQQLRQSIDIDPEVTHAEMLLYYERNQAEFQVPSRARWQQLTARFDRYLSKEEAGLAIAAMGNELVLGGTPFWAVAKRSSHGPKAAEGGYHDWTEWGDLEVSHVVSEAVFSLPVNQLSDIIEDAEGLHILRVLERQDAHVVPFSEAQTQIKEQLKNQKRNASLTAYLTRIKDQTPVWTE